VVFRKSSEECSALSLSIDECPPAVAVPHPVMFFESAPPSPEAAHSVPLLSLSHVANGKQRQTQQGCLMLRKD